MVAAGSAVHGGGGGDGGVGGGAHGGDNGKVAVARIVTMSFCVTFALPISVCHLWRALDPSRQNKQSTICSCLFCSYIQEDRAS